MTPIISNIVVALGAAFVISATSAITLDWKNQSLDSTFLAQNTAAVKDLTNAVRELQINQAVFTEKYITRTELDTRLRGMN